MIGKTILHYQIIEKLGEGGMGVVYLAEDTKLDRKVAIKFLPHQITADSEERKRFEIEAKAAAALNHPNIATIYAIEEVVDQVFLAMEYIEGQELKSITKAALPVEDVITYGLQIAQGLQAAHKKNIVHRDIKSRNIMITGDGKIKIMDFGLAKIHGSVDLTTEQSTIGTAAYMSPEQAKGEKADPRSDIWSFGVVLYEMTTGQLPFRGDYDQAVIYSIINEKHEATRERRSGIPESLDRIINRCLEKNLSDRYQNVDQLISDLQQINIGSGGAEPSLAKKKRRFSPAYVFVPVILVMLILSYFLLVPFYTKTDSKIIKLVVLPFENLGPEDHTYFADGMTEEITSRLALIKSLGVISRKSALLYGDTDKTIKQIGSELGVDYVLEGTVRWAKDADGIERVRITPQLIRARDDIHLWSDVYERVIKDIFQVQSDIAHKVVNELGINLLEPERNKINEIPTQNIEAYHLFLRGRYFLGRPHFTLDSWNQAISSFERAVEFDPDFALAYAELSRAHARLYFLRYDLTPQRLELAKNAADKAVQLAPKSPEVHLNLGYYYLWAHRDPDKAMQEFSIAEEGLPNNVDLMRAKSRLYETQGKWQELIEIEERAVELSPRDPSVLTDLIFAYWFTREYEKALKLCEKTISIAPETIWPYLYVAHVHWGKNGPNKESRAALKNVPSTHSFWLWSWYWQEVGERKFEKAFDLLANSDGNWMKNKIYVRPKSLLRAFIYDYLNDREQAFLAYDSTRIKLEGEISKNMDDPRYHSSLGVAYAGLGRKDDAIREGKKAVELLPFEKDAVYSTLYIMDLAAIYSMVGEYDLAIEQIKFLLSIPSTVSKAWLKMDIRFSPLYNQPRFLKMIEKYPGEKG